MHFIHININSLWPKTDEVRYIANITNASIVGISETKVDETILSSELEADCYDLVRPDRSRRGGGVTCYIKSSIAYSYIKVRLHIVTKTVFYSLLLRQ